MTLNIALHNHLLLQMLKSIYENPLTGPFLGLKGGTAAMMFYGLDRFSADLDFDLLDESKEDQVFEQIESIVKKFGTLREARRKRFNLLFVISYEQGQRTIKVEINRGNFGSQFFLKTGMGIPILVMEKEDMFAHKIVALYERVGKTSRDIYDVWFFLEHRWPLNEKMIQKRLGMSAKDLIQICIDRLEKMNNRKISEGLGELLTEKQKQWVRENLKKETISQLKLKLETF